MPEEKEIRKRKKRRTTKMLIELANDVDFFRGIDKYGNDWHVRMNQDGTQDWVRHQNFVINEGGRNAVPVPWNPITGLYRNIWEEKK